MWAIWRAPEARVTQDFKVVFTRSSKIRLQMSLIKVSFSQLTLVYQSKDVFKCLLCLFIIRKTMDGSRQQSPQPLGIWSICGQKHMKKNLEQVNLK